MYNGKLKVAGPSKCAVVTDYILNVCGNAPPVGIKCVTLASNFLSAVESKINPEGDRQS
jgi:hypothetical protein